MAEQGDATFIEYVYSVLMYCQQRPGTHQIGKVEGAEHHQKGALEEGPFLHEYQDSHREHSPEHEKDLEVSLGQGVVPVFF